MELVKHLTDLKLYYLAANLDQFVSGTKNPIVVREALSRMAELELIDRSTRSTQRRLSAAKLGIFQPIDTFDWAWTQGISKAQVDQYLTLDFIKEKSNLIFAGAQGLGKSMIAQNIANKAAISGHSVLYTSASKLVLDLDSQESSVSLQRRLKFYQKLHLLVIDELGYLNFTDKAADYIFEIVNRRYETGSIIITTNLSFKDWHKVFPGAPCVTAMIDRLTHHAEIIKLLGDSYRRREASNKKTKKEK